MGSLLLAGSMFFSNVDLTVFAAETDDGMQIAQIEAADPADGAEKDAEDSGEPGMESGAEDSGKTDAEKDTEDSEEPGVESSAEDFGEPGAESGAEDSVESSIGQEEDRTGEKAEETNEPVADTVSENTITAVAKRDGSGPRGLSTEYHTKEEIRTFIKQSDARPEDAVTYAEEPKVTAPYAAGSLSEETLQSAVAMLNQIRYVAGIPHDVKIDPAYSEMCQAASLVNYVNKTLTHDPEKPVDMDEELYKLADRGAGESNLALNYHTLNEAVIGWVEDSGSENITHVGHRRWVLNASMGKTGFGFVEKGNGLSQSSMYAWDRSNSTLFDDAYIAWPAQNTPLEYFDHVTPWSVSLGEYVDPSEIQVKLTRLKNGRIWNFPDDPDAGDFYVDNGRYGSGECIIFDPALYADYYKDGDEFEVEVLRNGESYLKYTVTFFELEKALTFSGVSISSKTYDGISVAYTGTPVLTDSSGQEVSGINLTAYYSGTLADGSVYEKSTTAPVQAGRYTLSFELSRADSYEYRLSGNTIPFSIYEKKVTVTAESLQLNTGDPLPELAGLHYTVDGLLESDGLLVEPSFRYGAEEISTEKEGDYEIIPYGADAGNNYSIIYKNGVLSIEDYIKESGTVNDISWTLDKYGKLTITGRGDYNDGKPPWAEKTNVLSAVVEVSGMTSMKNMFFKCKGLQTVDLSKTDTSQVTDMSSMFSYCFELKEPGLGTSDTGKVKNMNSMFYYCILGLKDLELELDTTNVEDMSFMFYGCESLEALRLNLNTANVKKMTSMFEECYRLTSLDLSSFDMSAAEETTKMLAHCRELAHIVTPKKCGRNVWLPDGTWYQDTDTVCEVLPQGLPYSIDLYRDQFPAGGKKPVYISGVSVEDRIYDGTAVSYADSAGLIDSAGTPVPGLILTAAYTGTLADGSSYKETTQAPSQAGVYMLSFQMAGDDAGRYVLNDSGHKFRIRQRKVTISAPDLVIRTGNRLPEPAEIKDYEVNGLLEGDRLITPPSFRYSVEEISTDEPGSYEVIPYGADAGSNYEIGYVNGTLWIKDAGSGEEPDPEFGDVAPEDRPEDGSIPEGLWIAGLAPEGYAYTGKALRPAVRVYDHKTLLQEKRDYSVAWTRNIKAYDYDASDREFKEGEAPVVTVKGKGNYTGKETQAFRIRPLDIGGEEKADGDAGSNVFEADPMTIVCNGKEQKPLPALLWNGRKLKKGKDYTITYYKDGSGRKIGSVKEPGHYQIELSGMGNFKGTRKIALRVIDPAAENLKPVSRLTVAKIPNQPYAGGRPDQGGAGVEVRPTLTVKDGEKILEEGIHYEVSYSGNTAVGTAYAVVTGIEKGGYSGTKRAAFRITGTPIGTASVAGLQGTISYEGTAIEPKLLLTVKKKSNGTEIVEGLQEGRDYTVLWQKNENAGNASAIFTGMGEYTGTMKKTFKIRGFDIAGNEGGRFEAVLKDKVVRYARGGARPKPAVTFLTGDGKIRPLTEGKDYTLSYRNCTAVTGESGQQSLVIVRGKGNFSGTYGERIAYEIIPQEIGSLTLTAQDKTYREKKNIFATRVTVTDRDGSLLKAGIDYDKDPVYTYRNRTEVFNEDAGGDGRMIRSAGERVDPKDVIPAGTVLNVKVRARDGGNYTGELEGQYRITQASIASASVSVRRQTYTGQEITLDKSQITVKVKGRPVGADQWEIVEGSYKNNVKKGTASVTIRGLDHYGGTRTVKFAIGAKGILWWWRK